MRKKYTGSKGKKYILAFKVMYISRAVSNFYGTEIKIWAGFGPVANTENHGDATILELRPRTWGSR